MRIKPRIVVAAVVIAFLGGLAWLVWQAKPPPPEPMFHGQPMSEWVMVAFKGGGLSVNEAIMRVEEAGTNAIPTLLRMESAHVLAPKVWLNTAALKLRIKGVKRLGSNDVNNAALRVMQGLGPKAAGAVPELIRIYNARYSVNSQNVVAISLAAIGPGAKAAAPSLLKGTASKDAAVRNSAYFALGRIQADPKETVPALAMGLKDPEEMARMQAAQALGEFGQEARAAVPALIEFIKQERPGVSPAGTVLDTRTMAMDSLRKIDPEAASKAELKDKSP